ncbi:MAG: hypothetical protein ACM3ML_00285 [Micromonosporaceae bacterium]
MKPSIVTRPAWWKLVMVACGLALLVAGCGSGGGTPSEGTSSGVPSSSTPVTTPPNAVLCADAAALRASLDKLTHVNVGAGTVSEITADLNDLEANLTALVNHARGQWQAQTSALKSALATLKTAVSNLAASPSTSAVSSVVAALGDVNTAAQNLLAAVNPRCPSASPSPSM